MKLKDTPIAFVSKARKRTKIRYFIVHAFIT